MIAITINNSIKVNNLEQEVDSEHLRSCRGFQNGWKTSKRTTARPDCHWGDEYFMFKNLLFQLWEMMQEPDAFAKDGAGVERHIINVIQPATLYRQIAVAAHPDIPANDPSNGTKCFNDIWEQILIQNNQPVRHLRSPRHVEQPDDPLSPGGTARSVRHSMHPFPAGLQAGGGQQFLYLRDGNRILLRSHDDRQLPDSATLQLLDRHPGGFAIPAIAAKS